MAKEVVNPLTRRGWAGLAEKIETLGMRALRARSAAYGREKDAGASVAKLHESVVQAWLNLEPKIPELATAIGTRIGKVREYVNRTKGALVHILAMVVNPAIKFDFIHRWWTVYDRGNAYEDVRETMIEFQREIYAQTLAQTRAGTGTAAHTQSLGYLRVLNIEQTLRRASDNTDTQGTIPIEATGAIDLIECWRAHEFTYPLLYHIAMDVLPVQASSVSSERVFSSSKMTCTPERN